MHSAAFSVDEVLAGELADVPDASGAEAFSDDEKRSMGRALRLALLARTYDYSVEHCEHYRQYGRDRITSMGDFRALPVLERSTLTHHLETICVRSSELLHHTATSGTTTGQSVFIPRSVDEQRILDQYRRAMAQLPTGGAAHQGITLRLVPGGRLIPGGTGSAYDQIGVYNLNMARQNLWDNWDYLIGQLFAEFPVGWSRHTITLIHATPPCGLVLLTRYMLDRGIRPAETGVRRLVATGGWIGKTTRRWLQDTWAAELATAYSCAELNEPARECRLTPGHYHFPVPVVPEVVSPVTHETQERGSCGRLLLTGTYPFHQACMLIRYAVGDWVRWLGDDRCSCGVRAPTVEFLGRESTLFRYRSPHDPDLVLASIPTLEALSRFKYVADIPRPQYRWDTDDGQLVLHVECFTVGGKAWQARAEAELAEALLEENAELAARVDGGLRLRIVLHARSSLTVNIGMR